MEKTQCQTPKKAFSARHQRERMTIDDASYRAALYGWDAKLCLHEAKFSVGRKNLCSVHARMEAFLWAIELGHAKLIAEE